MGDQARGGGRRGLHRSGRLAAAAEIADIGFETEVVVEPASAGSSFGVALARDAAQLRDALRCAARFDDRILTGESQVPRVFAAAGLPYEQLVARLVDAATVPGSRMSAIGRGA